MKNGKRKKERKKEKKTDKNSICILSWDMKEFPRILVIILFFNISEYHVQEWLFFS